MVKSKYSGKDKRKYERFGRNYSLRYRLWNNPADQTWHLSHVRNISGAGLLFCTNRPLAQGFPLELIVDEFSKSLKLKGKIVRTEISGTDTVFDVAAKFEDLSKKKQDNLQERVKKIKD